MKNRRHHRLIRGLVALALACAAWPAFAGELFRCSGKNGEMAYTNKPAGYANCVKVAGYKENNARPVTAATAPAASSPGFVPGSAPAANAKPGQWNYQDSTASAGTPPAAGTASAAPVAKSESPKVLRGAVYKVNKANGITEYTNIRPAGKHYQVLFTYISTCFACDVHSKVNFSSVRLNRDAYRAEIAAAAAEFGLDESLLRAVVHAESAFNPNALSNKGAQGLMQLMPGTADDMGVDNPFDAVQNIRGGAQYLSLQLKNFQGDERRAIAAYNAGPANVTKYGGVPPFDETQVYVSRVSTLRDRYRQTN
ncbi:lytic transglycosylase domain-containing protein [Tahibacter amnicola]|uniref:Lytic transglycosylase domain-containing protein n=1 Tax=Tahibacter amnicola TaxID=2976241 RepID=A0ABY6BJC6_9GAMM|nr:lytic transglycosylase domain-containing protein [Tahibacter amnicola]UXI69493.1 lytic transglycosylase domain-containing protein [Tahibacter amnicola]